MTFEIQTMRGSKQRCGIFTTVRQYPFRTCALTYVVHGTRLREMFICVIVGNGSLERCDLQFSRFSHANIHST